MVGWVRKDSRLVGWKVGYVDGWLGELRRWVR